MNLRKHSSQIEVFYDGSCGICVRFSAWLEKQPQSINIIFLPYQSEEAKSALPEMENLNMDKEMLVRIDNKEIYRGGEAWIWCLWSCEKYRKIAQLLNTPLMRPVAKKACIMVSNNRLKLSKLLFGNPAENLTEAIENSEDEHCENDQCSINKDSK